MADLKTFSFSWRERESRGPRQRESGKHWGWMPAAVAPANTEHSQCTETYMCNIHHTVYVCTYHSSDQHISTVLLWFKKKVLNFRNTYVRISRDVAKKEYMVKEFFAPDLPYLTKWQRELFPGGIKWQKGFLDPLSLLHLLFLPPPLSLCPSRNEVPAVPGVSGSRREQTDSCGVESALDWRVYIVMWQSHDHQVRVTWPALPN